MFYEGSHYWRDREKGKADIFQQMKWWKINGKVPPSFWCVNLYSLPLYRKQHYMMWSAFLPNVCVCIYVCCVCVCVWGLSGNIPDIVNIIRMVLHDIDVTWQPKRVDWNAHVWTMTSLYYSMGAIDAIEWVCVLCGHYIQNAWVSRAMNLHRILH